MRADISSWSLQEERFQENNYIYLVYQVGRLENQYKIKLEIFVQKRHFTSRVEYLMTIILASNRNHNKLRKECCIPFNLNQTLDFVRFKRFTQGNRSRTQLCVLLSQESHEYIELWVETQSIHMGVPSIYAEGKNTFPNRIINIFCDNIGLRF